MWLYRHPARQLLGQVARLINMRAAPRVVMRLVKVMAHAGDPLNEATDALAFAAAELDPTRSQDVDLEGVYRGTFVPWNSRLRRELTQLAATQWAAKCDRPVIRRGVAALQSGPLTTSWLLLSNQGRKALGEVMARMRATPAKRQVLQSLVGMYPVNALWFTWGLTPSRVRPLWTRVGDAGANTLSQMGADQSSSRAHGAPVGLHRAGHSRMGLSPRNHSPPRASCSSGMPAGVADPPFPFLRARSMRGDP